MRAELVLLLPVVLGLAFDGGGDELEDLDDQVIMVSPVSVGNDTEPLLPSVEPSSAFDSPRLAPSRSVRKCCPPGLKMYRLRVPYEDGHVTCKIPDVPDDDSHLWVLAGADGDHGFPIQCASNTFQLLDVNAISSAPEDFCVDKMVNTDEAGNALSESIMGSVCVSRTARMSDGVTVAKLVPFVKCCPLGQTYDFATRNCTDVDLTTSSYEDKGKDTKTLLSMVFEKNLSSYIDLDVGFPSCSSAMIDVAVFHLEYDDYLVDSNGMATIQPAFRRGRGVEQMSLPFGTFCMDLATNMSNTLVVKACSDQQQDVCDKFGCVNKCCPYGSFFGAKSNSVASGRCVPSPPGRVFDPQLYFAPANTSLASNYVPLANSELVDLLHEQFVISEQAHQVVFSTVIRDPCQELMYVLGDTGYDEHYLDELGELFTPAITPPYVPRDFYCVEDALDPGRDTNGIHVFMCLQEKDDTLEAENAHVIPITVGLLISSMFLAATLVTYCCLPALQNLHGKTLMCHVSSLLIAYLFLALTQILTRPGYLENEWVCMAIGNCVLFTFMSAFSWLNVMCVDIWRTFGAMRSSRTLKRSSASRRFRLYCVYSWGVSSAITSLSVIMDVWGGQVDSAYRPQMGDGECWFRRETGDVRAYGIFIYYAGPLLVQTCVNVVLFVLTAMNYSRIKTEISRLHDSLNPRRFKKLQADSNKLKMTAKLFVVMGVSWVLEVASNFFPRQEAAFYLPDVANALQGVMIFCIFVLKRKVMRALAVRLGKRKPPAADSTKSSVAADCRLMARKTGSNSTLFTSEFRISGAAPSGRISPSGRMSPANCGSRNDLSRWGCVPGPATGSE